MKSYMLKSLKIILLFFITIYLLIWVFTPLASRFFSVDLLKALSKHELVLSDDSSIRYNPFMSHLSIYDLSLLKKLPSGKVKEVFAIKELQLEVGLYQLIVDKFHISEFDIDGLYIHVDIQKGHVEVAGIVVVDPDANVIEEKEVKAVKKEVSKIMVKMLAFHLSNSTVDINLDGAEHRIDLDSLAVEKVSASELIQEVGINLQAKINNAPFIAEYDIKLQEGKGVIETDTSLKGLELNYFSAFLPESIAALSGEVSFKNKQKTTITKGHINIDVQQLLVALDSLKITQELVQLELGQQTLSTQKMRVDLAKDQTLVIAGQATLGLRDLAVYTRLINDENPEGVINKQQVLAQLKSLDTTGLTVDINADTKGVTLDDITLKGAVFSDDFTTETPPLALFSQLIINNINASELGLSVGRIGLAGLAIDAKLDENKVLSSLVALPQQENTETPEHASTDAEHTVADESSSATKAQEETSAVVVTPAEQTTPVDSAPAFTIALNEFSLDDDIHVNFLDESVKPQYKRDFRIKTLTVKDVDNTKPDEKTTFTLIGESQEYAHFNLSGFVKPFAKKPVTHLEGYFKEMSLPAVSTYMKEALDYVFDSGQLDLAVDVTIEGTDIDGDMDILMRGVELTAAEDEETGSLMDQTAIPFSMAIGMLKDRDGNIELSLPLAGDTSAPSFGLSGFVALLVKQAALSAAQDYIMTTFIPYANVVSIAMTAGDMLMTIRLNDLEYPAMEAELQPEHDQFLAEFAALLKDRDSENITLCGVATAEDLGKPAGTAITDADDKATLKALSLERMHHFKRYMVKTEKLGSSRLLLCTPQIDSDEEAKPRLTFTN